MRKLIVSANITLDGFMAGRGGELDWHFPFWTDEMAAYASRQLRSMDTILVGRLTYQRMAAYWPLAPRNDYSEMMNGYEKIVFSTTLKKAGWQHSRIVSGNMGEEVARLKTLPGRDMIIYGSASIVQALRRMDLVDEYQVWLHPVAIGRGIPLFKNGDGKNAHGPLPLKLLKTRALCSGVLLLHYEPESHEIIPG